MSHTPGYFEWAQGKLLEVIPHIDSTTYTVNLWIRSHNT